MKSILKYLPCVILLVILGTSKPARAQKAGLTGADSAARVKAVEVKKLQDAVEAAPDNLEAHNAYIRKAGINNPALIIQYDKWMKQYPQKANIPFAIGEAFYSRELPQAKKYLLKVTEIAPTMARAWSMLSIDADRWGQDSLTSAYMKKASLADTTDAGYAYYYAATLEKIDPDLYKQKVLDVVKRFPGNERGAQGLYWLAERAIDTADKIRYFEQLHSLYPPKKSEWSKSGMESLWGIYITTNPEKALALANEVGDNQYWKPLRLITENIIAERALAANQDYKGAAALFAQVKLPGYPDISDFYSQEQAALQQKAGDIKVAYDILVKKLAKMPTESTMAVAKQYGKKLGKTSDEVKQDIQNIRNSAAVAAYPFELGLYSSEGKLGLKDLKGKVVLLTFWFPGCGPCRGEFPHFQKVIDKFKGKNVEYIGINVVPDQDAYVLPFMANTRFSFIPLRGNQDFASKAYGVTGEPENFLIDQNGKIMFRNFMIDEKKEHSLEMMISSLLEKGS
ncbi:TlpA family protein disulfide reductase [Mucilaginibacter sp. SMC90]|uniref:TlpA disulfide reductase family protein n=1 Tax=Mucilaginibacter sp. SMC90 TaxID=2929803 RepID=UPI001FB29976|nr:TlpA disulfide reductase family protein [Mucilaginibacter sp. SMC90]UOE49086.1 TlpA family protein disulfide reductase [Mucilaginibacter sp. SMC90]